VATPLIVIVGTTASGKSELGIRLAQRLGGEIVSADSRQVYRGLDVGSGKVGPDERRLVPHHLLDVADVRQRFTVAEYQALAFAAIDDIWARGRVPLLVGGSGLYVRAVVDNPAYPAVPPRPDLRAQLERTALPDLVAQLQRVDPAATQKIDLKNPRRVVRALEVTLASGTPMSAQQRLHPTRRVDALQLGLTWPRAELRRRIRDRVTARLQPGGENMLDETRDLLAAGVPAERLIELGLEYRFLTRHLIGEQTEADMLTQLETAIAQFAKRQLTWFRHDPRIHWLEPTRALEQAEGLARQFLAGQDGARDVAGE
jgi:tRNA dimethylallyltransferase